MRLSHLRFVEDIYTKKNTKKIQDQVAWELIETAKALGEEYLQSQPEGEGASSNEIPLKK